MSNMSIIREFETILHKYSKEFSISIDEASDEFGETWLDISFDEFFTSVSFKPNIGFGIYTISGAYGERPDELFKTPEKAAHRIQQLAKSMSTEGELMPLNLGEMRKLSGASQVSVAKALNIKQPSIARIEKRGDVMLSSLLDYVETLGGRLETRVIFDDMEAVFELPQNKKIAKTG